MSPSDWSFNDLDLSGVQPQRGSRTLKPGRYACRIAEAALRKGSSGVTQFYCKLLDVNGAGYVQDFITLRHPKSKTDPKAEISERIGRERMKALTVFAKHPTPDHPGDVKTLNGLVIGVLVEDSENWTDDSGVERKGGGKPAKNGAYFPVEEIDPDIAAKAKAAEPAPKKQGIDDDIPF